jgi:hypothetical protein
MLFVCTHVHTPELCPSGDPEQVKKTVGAMASKSHAEKSGVNVHGSYIAPEEHVLYFVIEADNYGRIVDFFRPMMKMGTLRVTPVSNLADAVPKFE